MNKYKILKTFRVIISLFALLIFLAIFLLPGDIFALPCWQLIPAGIRTAAFFSAAAICVFTFFLLLTVIFGRVYCSFICPLGVIQDIAVRLAKICRFPRRKFFFTRNRRCLRYSVAAIILAAMWLEVAVPLGLLEPFAIFGRFSAAVAKPVFNRLNNLLVDTAGIENLYPLHNPPFSLLLLLTGGGVLAAVMLAAILRGRIFCNTLCPAGAVLGLLSKISWFKITLSRHRCGNCGECARVCKANCIDVENGIVDSERCVNCFNCVAVCGPDVVNYVHQRKNSTARQDLSRRDFLVIAGSAVFGAAVLPPLLRSGTPSADVVMPPGALEFQRFTEKCTGCQLCVSNCPGNVLKPASLQYGLSGFLQPRLDFNAGMCEYECTACSNICPNGALTPLTVKRKKCLQIGRVEHFRKFCVVVTNRTHCGACAEHCPTAAVHMVEWEEGLTIPKLEPEFCIGCGACEYSCPARPEKAIGVSGVKNQGTAKVGSSKQVVNQLKGKDFPF